MNIKHLTILVFLILGIISCKSSKKEMENMSSAKEVILTDDPVLENDKPNEEIEDCFYPRKTIRTITDEEGKMLQVSGHYVIVSNVKGRYQPCKVTEEFRKDGLEVIFSGDKLEIFPNERRIGTPLRLESLTLKKGD